MPSLKTTWQKCQWTGASICADSSKKQIGQNIQIAWFTSQFHIMFMWDPLELFLNDLITCQLICFKNRLIFFSIAQKADRKLRLSE